nr:hypothetical protein CFP56_09034 [Quercus suber]
MNSQSFLDTLTSKPGWCLTLALRRNAAHYVLTVMKIPYCDALVVTEGSTSGQRDRRNPLFSHELVMFSEKQRETLCVDLVMSTTREVGLTQAQCDHSHGWRIRGRDRMLRLLAISPAGCVVRSGNKPWSNSEQETRSTHGPLLTSPVIAGQVVMKHFQSS